MTESSIPRNISSHQAITNLLKYSESHENLLQKYTLPFFLNYFDRYTIEELEQKMGIKTYSKLQFVKELTSFILHCENQTLFLVLGIIDIYSKISGEVNREEINVKDFTQFLCVGISNQQCDLKLYTKEMPADELRYNPKQVRDIDLNPAIVYSCPQKQPPKISKSLKKKEKRVDKQKALHIFCVNRKKKEILTLGRLAGYISIFSLELEKNNDIVPNCFKAFNITGTIMSLAFSDKQQRVGCLVAHVGLVFWDYEDDFATEKVIKNTTGDQIYFLEVLQEWVTTTVNTFYTWDLKKEKIKQSITEANAAAINGIQEISHLRCLAISFTMKDKHKQVIIYRNEGLKTGSKMKLGHVGGQKIHYHRITQTLLILGGKQLLVYQIDQLSLDLSLVSSLKGHQTMMTCISDLQDGFVVTGDDRGTLRVWDLNALRCLQVLKVANTLNELAYLDNTLIFGDSRLNIIQLDQLKRKQSLQDQFGIYKFYNFEGQIPQIFIFTTVSCRIYSLNSGRINRVIQLCTSQEQIIAVQENNGGFLISTSRGLLQCYSRDFKLKWKMNNYQLKEEIAHIRSDGVNKLFTTVGKEGNLYVWNQQTLLEEGPRKSIVNSDKKVNIDVRVFDLSQKYGVMISGDKNSHLKLWDYESCKLCHLVELEAPACTLKIGEKYPLLAVGCLNQRIYLYTMSRTQNLFEVTFLQYGNMRYPQLKLNSLLSVDSASQMTLSPRRKALEPKMIISQHVVFFNRGGSSLMSVTYGRGNVLTYDISSLQSQFSSDNTFTRRAVNIQRPVKQTFEKQISKNQYRKTQKIKQDELSSYHKLKVVWNRKIHQDTITHFDTCQNTYFSTVSLDGSFKIISVEKGEILGSLSLRNPLPTLWKVQFTQQEQICRKVHQALTLINDILHHKETTQEEKKIFDICFFMKEICTKDKYSAYRKKRKSVKLLKEQLGNQENCRPIFESLKSMQAFKRVSLIRESAGKIKECNFNGEKKIVSLNDKTEMIKLLSPFHFPHRVSPKWFKEQEQKFNEKVAKSAHVSPTYSPEKLQKSKENSRKPLLLQTLNRRPLNYHLSRSLSQKLQKLDSLLASSVNCEKSRKSESINGELSHLKDYEPMNGVYSFIKGLNKKVQKEGKLQRHLKKKSGIIPKF